MKTSGRAQRSFPATIQRSFALAPAQFVNAMPTCHLTHPRAEGIFLILFLEDRVKFQEDFRRGVLSVLRVAKESTADLEDVRIASSMN